MTPENKFMQEAAETWRQLADLITSGQTGELIIGDQTVAALTTRLSVEALQSMAAGARSLCIIPTIEEEEVKVVIQIKENGGGDNYYEGLIERLTRGQKETSQRRRAYGRVFSLARAAATCNQRAFKALIKGGMPEFLADDPLVLALKEKAKQEQMPDGFELEELQVLGLTLFVDLPGGDQQELLGQYLDPRGMWQAGDQGS